MRCPVCGEPGDAGAFSLVAKAGTQAVELRFVLCERHTKRFYEHVLAFIPPHRRDEVTTCPIR